MGSSTTSSSPVRGAIFGLAAAALFGVSAPLSKLLLEDVAPLTLAGLLYVGAGLGLTLYRLVRRAPAHPEAPLRRADGLLLAGIVVTGGIVGPVAMLSGLQRVHGVAGALMLNLEAPLTILVALLAFREHLTLRAALAAGLIVVGAMVLALEPERLEVDLVGLLLLAGACLAWAVDNNLTQRVSLRDPLAVTQVKTFGAGLCTSAVAHLAGLPLPRAGDVVRALVLGAVGYGLSIVLDTYALRWLGAAREAAVFATAPFLGALAAIPILGEKLGPAEAGAGVLMLVGVALLVRERHRHLHRHDALAHDHLHVHDEHHQHPHEADAPPDEPHAHPHRHVTLVHDHPHLPDAHHRHRH